MSSKDYSKGTFLALGVVAGGALGAALALYLSKRAAAPPAGEGSTAELTPAKLWKCAKNVRLRCPVRIGVSKLTTCMCDTGRRQRRHEEAGPEKGYSPR